MVTMWIVLVISAIPLSVNPDRPIDPEFHGRKRELNRR
jgi:hypothetical protein